MKEEKKTSLNGLIYLAGIMVIIRHVVQIVTNIMLLSIGYDPAVIYNIAIGIIIIPLIVLILMQKKYALYAFFALQVINAIVISYLTCDWAVHLSVTAIICAVVAAALCLKHDGVSAWKAILGKKDTVTPTQEAESQPDIEEKQAPDTLTLERTPVKKEPKYKEPITETQTAEPQNKKSHTKSILAIVAFAAVVVGISYTALSHQEKTKEKKDWSKYKVVTLGKYLYLDKAMVIHAKNGCKAVFKDHNMQQVNPVEPECLSFDDLSKVCSQCVTEQMIDSLNTLFSKYRQSYNNVGNLYEDLLSRNYELPSELQFRKDIRVPEYRRRIYQILLDEKANVGTYEEFTEWLGIKPAKRKSNTQL